MRPRATDVLATVWFGLVFIVTAPVAVVIATLLFVLGTPFDRQRRAVHAFLCRWTFDYLKINPFWQVRVDRKALPQGPCVLVANHQSAADVIATMGLRTQFKFVSKASLFELPAVGWVMKMAKYISLERGRPKSTSKMLQRCEDTLKQGISILMFPEGTYHARGTLLPFKLGAFMLAQTLRVPLVPVTLVGTNDLLEGDGPWMHGRARIQVTVLPAIPPEALGEDPAELAERVRQLFQRALGLVQDRNAEEETPT